MRIMQQAVAAVVMALTMVTASGGAARAAAVRATPAQRTCTAFAAWERHRTTSHLDAMLTASERAPWTPIGADAVVLYTDVRSGENTAGDIAAMHGDCG